MSEPASISSGIAERYATAVFEIAQENKRVGKLEEGLEILKAALAESADLRALISSPVYTREVQGQAIDAIAKEMGLMPALHKALGLMAQKRRLFVLPQMVEQLQAAVAEHKGEVTAEVVSAKPLTKTQSEKLSKTLAARVGKTVKINATVDDSLIGGLVVKVGSKMIDSSIASKLSSLQNAMKEVG